MPLTNAPAAHSAGFTGNRWTVVVLDSGVVSVGNTTKFSPLRVTSTSNEAPFLSLLAPGTDIYAASFFGFYIQKPGTSMAAPHVAGAWAILKQAVPGASVSSVLAALRGTATSVTDTRTGRTFPFINVNAARVALAAGTFSTPRAVQFHRGGERPRCLCHGRRLRPAAAACPLGGDTLPEVTIRVP